MNIRYLLSKLFLVCVSLFVLSSILYPVHAMEYDENYPAGIQDGSFNPISTMDILSQSSIICYYDVGNGRTRFNNDVVPLKNTDTFTLYYEIYMSETIARNQMFDITVDLAFDSLENFKIAWLGLYDNSYALNYSTSNINVTYSQNTSTRKRFTIKDISNMNTNTNCITLKLEVNPSNNISSMNFKAVYSGIKVETVGNTGLLNGIIGWIQNIFNKLAELPNSIANAISGFFTWIVDAVNSMKTAVTDALSSLGNFIIDGIKGLFVPTSEDITNIQDDWNSLLEQRFGGLYESIEIIHDFYNNFTAQEKPTITIPKISLPFGDAVWTFGGWEVQIVPNGFSFLADACKIAISMICTFYFINGMRCRFENIIGGNE